MKRIALIGALLAVLLIADGMYMVVSRYNGGETQAWHLPDGWIIIISAAILLLASLLAFLVPPRPQQALTPASEMLSTTEQGEDARYSF